MRIFMRDGDSVKETTVDNLSYMNLRQAAAVADAMARLIPHEGVDYDIAGETPNFSFNGITDKGIVWCKFLRKYSGLHPIEIEADDVARINLVRYVSSLIPRDGIDYESYITFSGPNSDKITFKIEPMNEKGEFWRGYVMEMLKKYPPSVEYESDVLPEDPELVEGVPEEFKEVKDEEVVS